MDILYKKALLIITVILLGQSITAQEKVSKTISKIFPMTNAGELYLENKYGEINLTGWSKNSVAITIDISVSHKKKDNANELLNRIKPKINNLDDFVSVNFQISERKANLFNRYFSKVNPIDLDRSNVQVDYTIYLPENAEFEVINKFGDVIIDNWNGKLKADIQHGDLWINENLNNADIDVKYGKIKAKSINYGNIRLKNGGLDMEDSVNLRLTSAGSDIQIKKVTSLEVYSSKDKVNINEMGSINGDLKFTEMELNELTDNVNLTLKIAELEISNIQKKDAEIIINQVSSEIVLNVSGFAFRFDAILEQGLLRLPKTFENVASEMIDESKRIRKITATFGKKLLGEISIKGKKGVVLLKE